MVWTYFIILFRIFKVCSSFRLAVKYSSHNSFMFELELLIFIYLIRLIFLIDIELAEIIIIYVESRKSQ